MAYQSPIDITGNNVSTVINAGTTVSNITNPYGIQIQFGTNDVISNSGRLLGDYGGVIISGKNDTVTNQVGAYIGGNPSSYSSGVYFNTVSGTNVLVNFGTIRSNIGVDIAAATTNSVTINNKSGGYIEGSPNGSAIYGDQSLDGTPASGIVILNAGRVVSTSPGYAAIDLLHGGTINNYAGGVINSTSGRNAVYIGGGLATVTNAGTILGGVTLATNAANRVVVDPGALFNLYGHHVNGGTGVLELASATATGALNAVGSNFTNFSTLLLDSGAHWVIQSAASLPSDFSTIAGFNATDTIQLTGHYTATQSTGSGVTHVTLTNGGSHVTLNFQGIATTFQAIYGGGVTNLEESAGPTLTASGTVTSTVPGSGVTLDSTASISDTNNITSATIWISGGHLTGDRLAYSAQAGITGSFNTSTGTLVLTGYTSAAAFKSVIDSIAFSYVPSGSHTYGDPTHAGNDTLRTISWVAGDSTGFSSTVTSGVITNLSSVLDYGETIQEAGLVATSETVSAGVMTLVSAGVVGHITVGSSLNSGEFLLGNSGGNTTIVLDTVFGTYTSGLTLLTDPTTIAPTGTVSSTTSSGLQGAINGPSGTSWTLVNQGLISDTAANGIGISFAQAGTVINESGGRVTAQSRGIILTGGGYVSNASGGVIGGKNGAAISAAGVATVVNAGVIDSNGSGTGINLLAGGAVTNASGAVITGRRGIVATNVAATVVNAGSIIASSTYSGYIGVSLAHGGSVTNQAGGKIIGYSGVGAAGAAATVVNAGSIDGLIQSGNHDSGVGLADGGQVTNLAGGTITGMYGVAISGAAGTVQNLGVINALVGGQGYTGVDLGSGGTIINGSAGGTASTATIYGYQAVQFGAAGTVINYGTIADGGQPAVQMPTGVIINGPSGDIGARIAVGAADAVAITGAGTVVNYATIINAGTANPSLYYGVLIGGGGVVKNLGNASLIEGYIGVYGEGGVTVTNAGTIETNNTALAHAAALEFGTGTNRLIVDSGAVFSGLVTAAGTSTLELASGTSAGTISGLGVQFTGFSQITIDSNAKWTLSGYNTLAGGVTLAESGTDTVVGTLVNDGRIAASGSPPGVDVGAGGFVSNQSGGTISGYYAAVIGSATGTLINSGHLIGAGSGSGSGVKLTAGGSFTNSASGTVTGALGIYAQGGGSAASIVNAGSINGAGGGNDGVVLESGGAITNLSGGSITNGIQLLGVAGAVVNAGTVTGSQFAITVKAGGTVVNQSGGTISGSLGAVQFTAGHTGRVVDAPGATFIGKVDGGNTIGAASISTLELASGAAIGTLAGLGAQFTHFAQVTIDSGAAWSLSGVLSGFSTLANAGWVTNGVTLGTGTLTVTNQSGGTIGGGSGYGVFGSGAAATVENAGQISAASNIAVALDDGGNLTNVSGGTIIGSGASGLGYAAVLGQNAAVTVTNAGVIDGTATNGTGVLLRGGGLVTNQSGGTIESAYIGVHFSSTLATLVNAGIISGNGATSRGSGVSIGAGGLVSNQSGGAITGSDGIYAANVAVTVTNAGSIGGRIANGFAGIALEFGGRVTNQSGGRITGYSGVLASGAATVSNAGFIDGAYGVSLGSGGLVTNAAGATIVGSTGVYIGGATGTVQNAGTIQGTAGAGVAIAYGGTVTNQSGGTIAGSTDAVTFASGYTNRLVDDPGAVFTGTVDGGNAIGGASVSTLELVSATAPGAISGLGTQFINFAQIAIDANAHWTLGGYNTLASGVTLTNSGFDVVAGTMANQGLITGGNTGVIVGATGLLINESGGTITAAAGVENKGVVLTAGGVVSNQSGGVISSQYGIGGSGTVVNAGSIIGSYVITYAAGILLSGGALTNQSSGVIRGFYGVGLVGSANSVTNAGTIAGNPTSSGGLGLYSGINTTVTNLAGGVITGFKAVQGDTGVVGGLTVVNAGSIGGNASNGFGVLLLGGGTVVNSGAISGGTDAVSLASGHSNRLAIDPGARFSGTVDGGNTIGAATVSTLELAAGGSKGTLSGFGSQYINFGQITFDAGAQWDLVGSDATNALGGATIAGFSYGDTIDVTNFNATGSVFSNGHLTLTSGANSVTLDVPGSFVAQQFRIADDGAGGTDIFITPVPTIMADATASFTGGGSPVVLDGSIAIADPNGTLLTGATIEINGGFTAGDMLNYTSLAGLDITGSYDAADGELTLSGAASVVNYESALDSVTYSFNPGTGDPTAGGGDLGRTIAWIVNDATGTSLPSSSTLDVIHAPPTLTVGGTVAFTGGGSAVALDSTLAVTDPDSNDLLNSGTVSIANFVTGDVLSATTVGGIVANYNTVTGTLTLTGPATVADYQQVLDSVAYSVNPADADPTAGTDPATRTIDWTVSDGSSSNGTASGTSTVDEVHVAPAITAGATATFTGGGSAVTLDNAVGIVDSDSGGSLTGATVWINSGSLAGDVLNYASLSGLGIVGSYDTATGTLTLSGTASIASYELALSSVTYSFTPSNGDPTGVAAADTSRSIDWAVTDGSGSNGSSNIATSTLNVVHASPTISVGGTASFTGGGSAVTLDPAASVADADSSGMLAGASVWINSGSISGDMLNDTSLAGLGIIGSYNTATGTLTLSGTASIADYDSALDSVSYSFSPGGGDPTGGGSDLSRVIDWSVTDGSASNSVSNTGSSTLDVVHVAPTIAAGGTATFVGGGAPVRLDAAVTAGDADSNGDLTGATVWINSGSISGDMLNYASLSGLGITGSYNAATGTLTLSGNASIANYDSALASIAYSFNPGTGDPTGGGGDLSRTIDWRVSDGNTGNGLSNTGSSTLDVVHVAPTIAAGATATFDGGGSAVTLDGSIAITDGDSSDMLVGATVWINGGSFVSGDLLNYASLGGLGIVGNYNTATGTLTLSGTSSIANYQSALDSVIYSFTPSNADPTNGGGYVTRTISWSVNDGVAASNAASSTLNDAHIAPGVTASGTVGFAIGGTAAVLDRGIALSDPDSSGNLTGATVVVAAGFLSGDVLNFVNTGSIIGSYNASTGTLMLSGTASIAAYQSALASIAYSSTASDPSSDATDPTRTIAWEVTDGSSSNGVSNIGTTGLEVYGPPPVVGATSGHVANFVQQGSAEVADGAITVTDGDSATLTGATVTISSGFLAGDTLSANTGGTSISAVYSDGTLTLSGSDTLADYRQVLDSVSFASSATDPTNGGADFTRTLTWQVNDGRGGNNLSNIGTTTVDAHVRPVVTAGGAVIFGAGGGPILVQPTLGVADADTNPIASATLAIAGGFLTGDVLAFNNGTDVETFMDGATIAAGYDSGTGSLTFTESGSAASAADWQQGLASVTFNNSGTNPGNSGADPTRTLSWTLNTAETNPSQSSVPVTSTIDLAPPPAIGGTTAGQTTTDEAAIDPLSGVSITDPNVGQTETVVVTLSNNANGTLSDSVGGTINNGTYVVTGSTLAVTQGLDGLVFTPTPHQVVPGGTVSTTFTITATNSDGATDSNTTTSVIATAVDDPPTITQSEINIGVPNQGTSEPFAGLTIGDPDLGGHIGTLTVALSPSAGGTMSVLSGGTFDAATGVYTLVGTIAALTTALDDLVFTPSAPSNGSDVATTDFNVTATDSGGQAVENSVTVTAVTQVVGLASVPGGDIVIAASPNGTSYPTATPDKTNEAIVTDPVNGGAYSLPGGYQAAYLGGTANASLADAQVGNAVLVGNAGNDTLGSTQAHDTILGGTGQNLISASGAANLVEAGTGTDTISVSGTLATVVAAGTAMVSATGAGQYVFGSTSDPGALTVVATADNDTISAGTGAVLSTVEGSGNLVFGGFGSIAGGLNVSISGAGDTVNPGNSAAMVRVSGNSDVIYGGFGSVPGGLAVSLTGANDTVNPGGSAATVNASGNNELIYGTFGSVTGALHVTTSGSGDTINPGLDPTTVAASGSDDLIYGDFTAAGGGLDISIGGANATVSPGMSATTVRASGAGDVIYGTFGSVGGSLNVYLGGANETVNPGIDPATVVAAGNNDIVFGNYGSPARGLNVSVTGAGDTIAAGNSPATVQAGPGSQGLWVWGGAGGLDFTDNGGSATVGAGSGATSVAGGSAPLVFIGGAGNSTVTGGVGGTTLFGAASCAITFSDASGGAYILAGAGNETLNAGGAHSNDTLIAGSGAVTFTGGSGADNFIFYQNLTAAGGGVHDAIANFSANDVVHLAGYGGNQAATALAAAVSSGGNTTLTLSDNTQITFLDVASASALAGHIISA